MNAQRQPDGERRGAARRHAAELPAVTVALPHVDPRDALARLKRQLPPVATAGKGGGLDGCCAHGADHLRKERTRADTGRRR